MAKKNLPKLYVSPVVHIDEPYSYWLGQQELSGCTSILKRHLFGDKYANVPDFGLQRAADRGSNIHYEVSMFENGGISPSTQEGINYAEKIKPKLNVLASEYMVSDEEHFASSIDLVDYLGKKKDKHRVRLIDIKTMKSGLDLDYLSWQLSIYATYFEKSNPDCIVEEVAGLWLSEDNCELTPVGRIDDKIIETLILADKMGLPFENPLKKDTLIPETEDMVRWISFEEEYIRLKDRLTELENLKKKALDAVSKVIDISDGQSVETENIRFTKVAPTTRAGFNTAAFKEDHPELHSKYAKVSNVKGYVRATLKNKSK